MSARYLLTILCLMFLSAASVAAQTGAETPTADLNRLVSWMTGSFSSQEQAAADSAFFDIRLQMAPIWTDRTDGCWLYVEQATATHLDQPYRQRVYRVTQLDDTTFQSSVFTLTEPLRYAGAWAKPSPLADLTADSLEERTGCAIVLHPEGDSAFAGATVGRGCASDLRGATYATSEVRITARQLTSWDRGWDSDNKQVWGAESGGYVFIKLTESSPAVDSGH